MSTEQIAFGSFRFDPVALRLWKDGQAVAIQPKPLAVLCALATRPGQVVTKLALLKEVWAGTHVTHAVLKVAVRALREALGESADAPGHVETVGRAGYRFVGTVASSQHSVASSQQSDPVPIIVGREVELTRLHNLFEKALRGEPQFVFVTGESGIGKTTLLETFRRRLETRDWRRALSSLVPNTQPPAPIFIGHGQCVEQYGQGEPYLPVLEAMGRLCREAGGEPLVTLLRKHAPTWVVQLPGVIAEAEMQALRLQVQGATQQRMLRELAEAMEVGTTRQPLVLLFEDLHWSDSTTIEFLSYVAKRRQPMRLLVVATYRPVEVVTGNHPLKTVKQELQAHGLCEEIRLELLKKAEIEEYVAGRFSERDVVTMLAPEVHRRTDGNPLFMVNVVEQCLTQGLVVQEQGRWVLKGAVRDLVVPENLRQLIARQVERVPLEQRRVLEGASVAGAEFAVAAVAAALKQDIDEVETICEEVAGQGHFLEERGIAEWPDGTVSGQYGFRHVLYQKVLYERIAEARRARLHRLIGERLETGYGEQEGPGATELAIHFEQGRDYQHATYYLQRAGENALQKSAHQEALSHLTKGLELLKTLPNTSGRAQQELALRNALGPALIATKGYATSEAEDHFTRVRNLLSDSKRNKGLLGSLDRFVTKGSETLQGLLRSGIRQIGFPTLIGLAAYHLVRGELQTSRKLGERGLRLAERAQDPALLLAAHVLLGIALFYNGEFVSAQDHLEKVIARYDPEKHHAVAYRYAYDPGVTSLSMMALVLALRGHPERARKRIQEALTLAQQLSHPFSLSFALGSIAIGYQFLREDRAVQEKAETLIALAGKHEFPLWSAIGTILHGWTLAEQGQQEEGIVRLRLGLSDHQATRAASGRTYYLSLLAKTYEKMERTEEGLAVVTEVLDTVRKNKECVCEAELYRLKGELTLQSSLQHAESSVKKSGKATVERQQAARDCGLGAGFPLLPSPSEVVQEVEGYFLTAIKIAQQQQAKLWELRATMSLARLWRQQGKQREALTMLADIYTWFTEGFDTKDLQEAKALLQELAEGIR